MCVLLQCHFQGVPGGKAGRTPLSHAVERSGKKIGMILAHNRGGRGGGTVGLGKGNRDDSLIFLRQLWPHIPHVA